MTTIEPLAPLPEEPLLPATMAPSVPYTRKPAAPMPMVRVNLLPAEVTAARRGHRTRRRVLVLLTALVLVLAAVSLFVRSGIGDARGELAAATAVNTNLTAQQGTYSEVVTAQSDLADALGRLGDLTATDVAWADVTRAIRAAAPAGVTVTGVEGTGASDSGTAGSAGGAPGGAGAAPDPGAGAAGIPPGAVVVVGFAPDPATVAAFVDALAKEKALADVVATGVAFDDTKGLYGFGITADVTATALSHRFDPRGGS